MTTFPSMRRCLLPLLTGCLLWTGWSDLHAQEISHSTPASEAQLQDWLESGNPKLISWAATLARERHDAAFIARLPDWLHRSALITDYEYAPNRRDRRAYDAVLDALIRGDDTAEVEFLDLQELARVFPAQAFLLINRLPADKQLAILKEWFSLANLSNTRSGIAHLAAMRLAQWPTPVPGFAARILTESEEQLTIILQSRQTKFFGVGTGGCGDSLAQQPESGWPVVYTPTIEEGPNSLSGQPLIALDDDRVSYRWVEENSPGGSCAGLTGLDQRARHQILAHWLGVRDSAMGWHANMSATIVWSTQKVFKAALGDIVSKQQDAFSATVEGLTQRGLLSKSEASYSRPKLIVRLVCDINPCPIANIATRQPPDILHSLF